MPCAVFFVAWTKTGPGAAASKPCRAENRGKRRGVFAVESASARQKFAAKFRENRFLKNLFATEYE
ncbi:hypothetical protein RCCGEPOP_23212 [Rhizobium sp. Pop5]|nr:hypothetical protein RCCGEPOP_23212 [Rhizobium sp. Pop5]